MARWTQYAFTTRLLAGIAAVLAVVEIVSRLVDDQVSVTVALVPGDARLSAGPGVTPDVGDLTALAQTPLGGSVDLQLIGLSTFQRLLSALPPVTFLATAAVALLLLGPVVRDLRRGTPFVDGTPRRLSAISGVVAVGTTTTFLGRLAASDMAVDHLGAGARRLVDGVPVDDLLGFVVAYVVLVVAEAAWYGKRLADDVEGLV